MPKRSKLPGFRTHVKRGKAGQVWVSYSLDRRSQGLGDVPLGTDRAQALLRYAELVHEAPRLAGTLEAAFRAWEARALPEYSSKVTRDGYTKCLRALRPVFGGARWEEVTLPTLVQYLQMRTAKTRGKHELRVLSVVWNWSRLQGFTALPYPAHGMRGSRWMGPNAARQVEVSQEAFQAIYRHACPVLRDALDIATATGLRVTDVLGLRLSDVRGGLLVVQASKTGKVQRFRLAASQVLPALIERRRQVRAEHVFLLAEGLRPVTYRRLTDRFTAARAEAAKECPEAARVWLRDMRKLAAQAAPSLQAAGNLLGHGSTATTRRHYRPGEEIDPLR